MHDPVTDRDEIGQRKVRREPVQRFVQHFMQVFGDGRFQRDVVDGIAVGQMQRQRRVAKVD
jgi:hypothetical protein